MARRVKTLERSLSEFRFSKRDSLLDEIFKDEQPNTLDVRISALEERINASDTFYRVNSQKLTFLEKQFKSQHQTATTIISDIENSSKRIEETISQLKDPSRDIIRDKISLYFQLNNTYILSSLLNRKKKLATYEKSFTENFLKIDQLFNDIQNEIENNPKDKDAIKQSLKEIIEIQNVQIAQAQKLFPRNNST